MLVRLLVTALFSMSFAACGERVCGGHPGDEGSRAPKLDRVWLLEEQVPGDPWTVLLGASFRDADGDLEGGMVEFYLDGNREPAASQSMTSVLRQSGLPLDSQSGDIWLTLRFAEATVQNDTNVRLSTQLVDGANSRSNCFALELILEVTMTGAAGAAVKALETACRPCSASGGS